MKTQKQLVIRHMRQFGSITTLLAFKLYGVCRLSERVRELERDGNLINHTPIVRNKKRYVAYSLVS